MMFFKNIFVTSQPHPICSFCMESLILFVLYFEHQQNLYYFEKKNRWKKAVEIFIRKVIAIIRYSVSLYAKNEALFV